MIAQATTACSAVTVAAGGVVSVECAQYFLGIPREVLYAALAGACAGLAQRKRGDWDGFLKPVVSNAAASIVLRSLGLAFTIVANALACAWLTQILQYVPLAEGAARAVPVALAGGLAWGSQRLLPAILDRVERKVGAKDAQ